MGELRNSLVLKALNKLISMSKESHILGLWLRGPGRMTNNEKSKIISLFVEAG